MKRVAAMVCAGLLVCGLASGCGKKEESAVKPVTAGFSCDVAVEFQGMSIKGTLSRAADGVLCVAIAEPPALQDITVDWDGETMTMQLGGVRIPVDAAQVPQGALIKQVLAALTAAPAESTLTDEGYVLTGTVEDKEYTIVCAPDTGLIRSLQVPENNLTVSFDHVKIIQ